jgi:DNA-binding protein HU-beta
VNKSQLIDALAQRYEGNRKAAQHALESVLDTITREVAKGEKVAITGFGSFEKQIKKAGWARNPATGERIKTKKRAVPKFRAGAELRDVVAGVKKLPKLTLPSASSAAKKASAAPARAAAAVKGTASKATATRSAAAKKSTAKTAAKKAPAKTTAKKAPAKKAPAKSTAKSTAKKAPAKKTAE